MGAKSFKQFVEEVANSAGAYEHEVEEDPETARIFGSTGDYRDRVSRAVQHFKGRRGNPHSGLVEKLQREKDEADAKAFGEVVERTLGGKDED